LPQAVFEKGCPTRYFSLLVLTTSAKITRFQFQQAFIGHN